MIQANPAVFGNIERIADIIYLNAIKIYSRKPVTGKPADTPITAARRFLIDLPMKDQRYNAEDRQRIYRVSVKL